MQITTAYCGRLYPIRLLKLRAALKDACFKRAPYFPFPSLALSPFNSHLANFVSPCSCFPLKVAGDPGLHHFFPQVLSRDWSCPRLLRTITKSHRGPKHAITSLVFQLHALSDLVLVLLAPQGNSTAFSKSEALFWDPLQCSIVRLLPQHPVRW